MRGSWLSFRDQDRAEFMSVWFNRLEMTDLWSTLYNNRFLIFILLFFAYNLYEKNKPFPESGGRTMSLKSDEDWDKEVDGDNGLVLVDFYGTFCPPCKTAAPLFGKLSERYPGVKFLKVNIQELRQTATNNGIQAVPTFKLYNRGQVVGEVKGGRMDQVEKMLTDQGALEGVAAGSDSKQE